jgi:hypothetical protein
LAVAIAELRRALFSIPRVVSLKKSMSGLVPSEFAALKRPRKKGTIIFIDDD